MLEWARKVSDDQKKFLLSGQSVGGTFTFASPNQMLGGRVPRPPIIAAPIMAVTPQVCEPITPVASMHESAPTWYNAHILRCTR